ncbi:N-acetyltransferase family protein [Kytococcus sp. Marseille-QA3725]
MSTATIRPRRDTDLPPLAVALLEQQEETGYPHQNPIPAPVESFLQRPAEVSAWVTEQDEQPVGHAAVLAVSDDPGEAPFVDAWCEATGRTADELQVVAGLFVARPARGNGAGVMLLRHVTDQILEAGCVPCLDVLATHDRAIGLYRHLGWREVTRQRPAWLRPEAPDVIGMVLDPPPAPNR